MRVLHVGSGFRPLRAGGLVAYIEELMSEQVRRGDDVAYFFAGRYYPLVGGPRLKRWRRNGVEMIEIVNSPLYDHGRQPELEISEPRVEQMFERALTQMRPDVVHVQELAGLPFSVLDLASCHGVPVVVTLQDYFPICSTFKLLDAGGRVCMRREIGTDCAAATAADPRAPGLLFDATMRFELTRTPMRRLYHSRLYSSFDRAIKSLSSKEARRRKAPSSNPPPPASFQRRREMNVERLNAADCTIAMSRRVAEIYSEMGVRSERLRTMQLTLTHIERLRPRPARPERTLTFATLAGFESEAKGAMVLIDAIRQLTDLAAQGSLRLLVFGHVDPVFRAQARGLEGIEIRGSYRPSELDALLDEVDVGLMPSVWEEAYGYAGIEFLAKGIPVIANAIGALPEYTVDGETGWLNRSCSGSELARIMRNVIEHPEQVGQLNERILATRDSIVKPMADHAEEVDAVYRELCPC